VGVAAEETPALDCYDSGVAAGSETELDEVETVFLDRDGVLNEKAPEGEYVSRWENFHLLDGVAEALARLNRAGLRTIVVTNQRGVALGLYKTAEVQALHTEFQRLLAGHGAHIDAFYICPHDRGQCNCRKPLPGLFEQALADFQDISAEKSVMIGDSLVDMEFGKRLGMKTILIAGPAENRAPGGEKAEELADLNCDSLLDAVELILAHRLKKKSEKHRDVSRSWL
jgi:D-glycero-D-manno-heptose 1,7-bisphosphate phosphatase